MYTVKNSKKTTFTLKDVSVVNGKLVDEDGVIVNIVDLLYKAFGNEVFTIQTSLTVNDEQELDDEVNE